MNKICKGDEIIVIAGRDKGRRGKVTARAGVDQLVIEGINVVRKHVKPNPLKGVTGGVMERAMPIHQSNVAIYNKVTGKADGVRIKVLDDGARVRVFKSSGEEIKAA